MRQTIFILLTVAVASVLVPRSAAAAEKVYVVPYAPVFGRLPVELGVKTARLVAEELEAQEGLSVVTGPTLQIGSRARTNTAKTTKNLARAEKLVARGDQAMGSLEFEDAVSKYKAALKMFEQNVVGLEDFDRLTYVRLNLATAMFRTHQEGQGERVLADVVRTSPETTLDASLYPPVFLRTFNGIRRKMLRLTRGAVSVVSNPPGAKVSLDGRLLGVTPIIIKDLVRGKHVVRVDADGADPWVRVVDVSPTKVGRLEVDLGGSLDGPVGELVASVGNNEITKGVLAQAGIVAKKVGARFLIIGAMDKGEGTYEVKSFLYDSKSNELGELSAVTFDTEMLGAAIEVYRLASEIKEAISEFPDPVDLPVFLFQETKMDPVQVAEVSAAPAAPSELPRTRPAPVGPVRTGPIASSGPLQPARPIGPAAAPLPRERVRGPIGATSRAEGSVQPVSGPLTPVSGPLAPAGPALTPRDERPRERLVSSVGGSRARLPELGDPSSGRAIGPRFSAVDVEDIVIPKDEVEEEGGIPWWGWGLMILGVGALGAGGYYAVDQGVLAGKPTDAEVVFKW